MSQSIMKTIALTTVIGLLTLAGCDSSARQSSPNDPSGWQRTDRSNSSTPIDPTAPTTTVATQPAGPINRTRWDRIEIAGQPVGYQATTLQEVQEKDRVLRRATARSKLIVKRFRQTTTEQMEMASRTTSSGQVLQVESKLMAGSGQQYTRGRRQGNTIRWQTSGTGKQREWVTQIPAKCGGYFAIEWSLRTDPMKPSETRQLNAILPVLNQPARVTLTSTDWAQISVDGRTLSALPIDQRMTLPTGSVIQAKLWMDRQGEIIRSAMPGMQQVSFRTDRASALAAAQSAEFDLGRLATVSLPTTVPGGHQSERVRYRVTLKHGNPADFFPQTDSQTVTQQDAHTVNLTVRRLRPGGVGQSSTESSSTGRPDRQFDTRIDPKSLHSALQPTALIQSDDAAVRRLASQVQPLPPSDSRPWRLEHARQTWQLACKLEQLVHASVSEKNFSSALASAADVVRTGQGDCTEHAVLLAALCRAHRLPARVVLGLVYVPSQQVFVFHMWNEACVGSRWIPLDATLGLGGIGAAHLVVTRSELSSDDSFSAFLPIMNVIGQLTIEVVE